ncbi:MAG: 4Fe-4S binding protein, partial [Candidatus Melainabacteria bacterium]|nr:4Fe-4S binding protein [Candidatus Melainabacteria bacterium]
IDCGACGIVCPVSCISNQFGKAYAFLKPKDRPKATVNEGACTGCQYCTDICPFNCLEIRFEPGNGFANATANNAHPNKCVACKLCVLVCPREAIVVVSEGGREVA